MIAKRLFDFPGLGWTGPFAEMERMRRDMDRLSSALLGRGGLREVYAGVFPSVNLTEDKERYYIRAELPGMETKDIDIQVSGSSLTITGEREIPVEKDVKYHRKERDAGKFSRVIKLPDAVDTEKIEAGLKNGILTVTIPKAETAKPRQIAVK